MFSKAGDVLRVIMGLDKQQRTPCGFAFGEERGRTLPCVCVSLGGVERGKGGGRGGEEEGREGEKLIFFGHQKKLFFKSWQWSSTPAPTPRTPSSTSAGLCSTRGRSESTSTGVSSRGGSTGGASFRKEKIRVHFFWGGGFFRSSWTPFLAHLCLPSSLLPSPSLPPSLSFPLKKK